MQIESPAILSVDGVIKPDFTPQAEEWWVELELKGKRGDQEKSVTLKERKVIIRHFGLVQYDHDYRLPDAPRWYIGREESVIFWHVFSNEWNDNKRFVQIKPGLNIYVCSSNWGGLTKKKSGGGMTYGPVDADDGILQKLQLLKTDEQAKEKISSLEKSLGEKLREYVIRSNWIEWLTIKFSSGRKPLFEVPEPCWTIENVRILLPHIRQELKAGWDEGLADCQQKAQKIIDYMDRLRAKDFNPQNAITKLVKMFWHLWPWYSHVHGALHESLHHEITKLLKNAIQE